jgi:tetratricopeptide (TPR) repeat protein
MNDKTVEEILEGLKYYEKTFPRELLLEAVEKRELITDELLKVLSFTIENFKTLFYKEENKDKSYMAYVYAMFLLAQFREKRAYKLLIDFFSIPDEKVMYFNGDIVTEDLPRLLASVYDGEISLLKKLIENRDIDEYIRSSGIRTFCVLVNAGKIEREEAIEYFRELFNGKLETESPFLWNCLVTECDYLYPEELYSEIKHAYEEDLPDNYIISLEDIEYSLEQGKEKVLNILKNNRHHMLIDDVVSEMGHWACFKESEREISDYSIFDGDQTDEFLSYERGLSETHIRKTAKIGRNDPCPCGSGKKYKKCCLK